MSPKPPRPLLPGSTIGILGSGQLGRMLALEARAMGYRVHVFSPGADTPTGQVADREVTASYDDLEAIADFASGVDVVTFEFENVPAACAEACAERVPVRPAQRVLHVTQNRLREKTFLSEHGIPVTPFAAVRSDGDLEAAFEELGVPAVLKTAGWGYDGKGQEMLGEGASLDQVRTAWESIAIGIDDAEAIWESFVPYELELSVVAARALDGQVACFAPFANHHENHILDLTRSPAPVPSGVALEAEEIARRVVEALDVVGVLCVELFWVPGDDDDGPDDDGCTGRLLVNELAPRPHNSGHLTFGACVTSQFEQQLRAVCGLPLGDVSLHGPAAMANLLGDLWLDSPDGEPDWRRLLELPDVKLHLYGKAEPRRGRKMGHLTAIAPPGGGVDDAARRVLEARAALAAGAKG